MRVSTERDRCVASGQCVMVAPMVFDQDDEGMVVLLNENPGEDAREVVEESVRLCPASAILAVD
ncbi:ferredoxin [Saccharopolyspora sp. 5N708]|uniref:ferredoxin n=1 Tax=Saccharopolyspora sp. 5N708 TaxID=3457424 RepID=UPI003FD6264D